MNNNYTCVFGGGAIRGLAYIGAMEALQELEIICDKLVGSSVGAIFAALYSLGYTPSETKDIMYDFNAFMFKDLNFGLGADFALSKGDVFENWIRENIEKKFYGEKYQKGENPPVTFRDIDKDLYICSTDLSTNTQFIFSKSKTPDFEIAKSVRISACFPGLMKPVEYEDKILVDGDLAKSLPLWKCYDELITPDNRILEFRLEGCRECMNFKNIFDYFNAVYSTMSNFSTENIIKEYKNKDKIDYILIDTKDVILLDFQIPNEMKDNISKNGYYTTMEYFTKTLVKKKKKILPLYKNILEFLKQLKPLIKKGQVSAAKKALTNFICEITEDYKNIDFIYAEDLKKFKTAIFQDIKEQGLFSSKKITHTIEHSKVLQGLIEKCEQKISDITEYIEKYQNYSKLKMDV